MSYGSSPHRVGALATTLVVAGTLAGCAVTDECRLAACRDDAKITAEVRTLINANPALASPNLIRVHTRDHVVYLTGQVNTDLVRSIADSLAGTAAGVTRVVDSIGIDDVGG
jgi:osmotically-inducible protein OsmY